MNPIMGMTHAGRLLNEKFTANPYAAHRAVRGSFARFKPQHQRGFARLSLPKNSSLLSKSTDLPDWARQTLPRKWSVHCLHGNAALWAFAPAGPGRSAIPFDIRATCDIITIKARVKPSALEVGMPLTTPWLLSKDISCFESGISRTCAEPQLINDVASPNRTSGHGRHMQQRHFGINSKFRKGH